MKQSRLNIAIISTFALLVTACGGSAKEPENPEPPPPTEPEPPAKFVAMKFFDGDKAVVEVREDGVVILLASNAHIGTLQADGSFETPDGKKAHIADDGKIVVADKELPFTIGADASVSLPNGPTIKLEDNGTVSGMEQMGSSFRVEGATTPEVKRTAMFLLVLMTAQGAQEPPAPVTEDGAEPAVPPTPKK